MILVPPILAAAVSFILYKYSYLSKLPCVPVECYVLTAVRQRIAPAVGDLSKSQRNCMLVV
jgi:hypothetical protein